MTEVVGTAPPGWPARENTATLLGLARGGDLSARERLFGRYLPILSRWAHHRSSGGARELGETDDLVQDTLIRALARLDSFVYQREGAFLAYLRGILMNAIRDRARRAAVRPRPVTLEDAECDPAPSPLEVAIGWDCAERIERALSQLDAESQQAIILRIEFGLTHEEIAMAMDKPSPDSARMAVARALVALAKAMHRA
ncbi:MAG: sigma-70 family RNA polymerase sigma factor [Candidatus Eisenbacteria bacterium]|uniref:Sigma-70 family RNA polymerase sigma factor n=1 Tax=Eiseniibacteriota bacterium TaxID=2212470 RepID=A0A956SFL7_UNCEI|nr:sigma-70 family RNA polymerase sigma factor [Candidatus Eisenbacteria bacterium]MCB9465375.1 sigma-70 family RNA polymerase sigma factor [Candidatus Eisenbacteria bacterium]